MKNTSQTIARLHEIVRSLEDMRNEVSTALIEPDKHDPLEAAERATLSDLHRRISAALAALSAEARDR